MKITRGRTVRLPDLRSVREGRLLAQDDGPHRREKAVAYVLMIDDNPQTRKYVEKIFRYRSKHELGFATTASEAVESLVQRRPNVIMLDLFIPGMDGIDFFHSIRNHPATESIPVIMHSPVELDQLTKLRLKRVRFEGFAQFPIAASELNELIATALKRNEVSTKKRVPPAV